MSLRASSDEYEAKKPLQSKYQIRTAVFLCSVLAAPGSRAAVSLSYLTARAKSECWKVVVNLVFLALGQLSTATLSLAIVRGDNPL